MQWTLFYQGIIKVIGSMKVIILMAWWQTSGDWRGTADIRGFCITEQVLTKFTMIFFVFLTKDFQLQFEKLSWFEIINTKCYRLYWRSLWAIQNMLRLFDGNVKPNVHYWEQLKIHRKDWVKALTASGYSLPCEAQTSNRDEETLPALPEQNNDSGRHNLARLT